MEVALKRLLLSQWTANIQVKKVTPLKAVMSFAGEYAFYLFIFFYDSITFCMVLYVPKRQSLYHYNCYYYHCYYYYYYYYYYYTGF